MVVIEEGRCVYANAAFEQISGYAFGELAAMESLSGLVERELDVSGPQLTLRRRDGAAVLLELARVPLQIPGRPRGGRWSWSRAR